MNKVFLNFVIASCCISCKKDNTSGEKVEIYLLKTFSTVSDKCQVDPVTSTLNEVPLIKNEDILAYSASNYQFKLSTGAFKKIQNFTDFIPFAVTVDKKVIYFGIFKSYYSSSSCEHSIVMNIGLATANAIDMKLGYPGFTTGLFPIDDQRNNPKLIETLKSQGKLR